MSGRILDLNLFVPPRPIGVVKFGDADHAVYPLSSLTTEDYAAFIDLDEHIRTLDNRHAIAELGRLIQKLVPTLTDKEIRSWRVEQLGRVVVWVKAVVAEDIAKTASGGAGGEDPLTATPATVS